MISVIAVAESNIRNVAYAKVRAPLDECPYVFILQLVSALKMSFPFSERLNLLVITLPLGLNLQKNRHSIGAAVIYSFAL